MITGEQSSDEITCYNTHEQFTNQIEVVNWIKMMFSFAILTIVFSFPVIVICIEQSQNNFNPWSIFMSFFSQHSRVYNMRTASSSSPQSEVAAKNVRKLSVAAQQMTGAPSSESNWSWMRSSKPTNPTL